MTSIDKTGVVIGESLMKDSKKMTVSIILQCKFVFNTTYTLAEVKEANQIGNNVPVYASVWKRRDQWKSSFTTDHIKDQSRGHQSYH